MPGGVAGVQFSGTAPYADLFGVVLAYDLPVSSELM